MTTLADAALRMSLVLLIGLALRAALRRRSPALRHAVLAAAIIAAPVVGLIGAVTPGVSVPAGLLGTRQAAIVAPARGAAATGATQAAVTAVSTGVAQPDPPVTAGMSWTTLAFALWSAGAAISLGWLLVAVVRLRGLVAKAVVVEDVRWRQALDAVCHDAALRRPVRLLVAPQALLLATWGWRRPRVVIPACGLGWSDERMRTVLAHEVAHVVRHDWLLQSVAEILRALLWWNPLAWLACRALRNDSELACDDAVLQAGVGATAYADHLVQIARIVAPGRVPAVAVMRMARVSTLERRIVAMLNPRLDRRLPTRPAVIGVAAVMALLVLPVAILRAGQTSRQLLEGVVYDTTGAVLPGVTVVLDADAAKVEVTTDPSGRFRFDGVEPGQHSLQVELPGFRALRQPIQLKNDADWNRAVTLQVGDLKETISVRQRRPATITPLADAAAGPTRVRVGGNIRAPRKTHSVNPVYPSRMVEAGLEGQVSVEAVIGVDGRVVRARPTTVQAHPELAQAAVDAVRQWRFEPTLLNGAPIEVVMSVSVSFSLE
jgi:TonB family protein